MFKKNTNHEQLTFSNDVENLPDMIKDNLKSSWAETFYSDYFSKIDESVFTPLYSDKKSRPNVPVNVLLGLETIKSGFGWSDKVLYDNFLFNMKIRYALGLHNMDECYFAIRTLYNFRANVQKYEQDNNVDLIKKAFEKITDKQIEDLQIKTGTQRMDSTLVQSNIQNMGRLQLVVECILNLYKVISDEEKNNHTSLFEQYVKENSLRFCYRVKSKNSLIYLKQAGKDIEQILFHLKEVYSDNDAYKQLDRVFSEHFEVQEEEIEPVKVEELKGCNLQSPHDPEATYRKKGKDKAKGFVSNITETCDSENDVQLITNVSTESNVTDDQDLYANDTKEIKDRMKVEEIYTDGGYEGEKAETVSKECNVDHKATAIKGKQSSDDEKITIDDFEIERNENGELAEIKCPNEKNGTIENGRKPGRKIVVFDKSHCNNCPFASKCSTVESKRKPKRVLRFSDREAVVSERRKRIKEMGKEKNIRAAVESTVRSVIHPFGGHLCKMPVRGKFRIAYMIILSAAMVNVKRIHRKNIAYFLLFLYFSIKKEIFLKNVKSIRQYVHFVRNTPKKKWLVFTVENI